ncbi:unnamed protein product [Calypogeia fissa]
MTNECKKSLLKGHYGSEEEKKKYHHPSSNNDKAIRDWCSMWSMWCYIDYVGCIMVEEFARVAFDTALMVNFSGLSKEFVESQKKLYWQFVQETSPSMGNLIWQDGGKEKGTRDLWIRCIKRCVIRWFIHSESSHIGASMWKMLPPVLVQWIGGSNLGLMYPADGVIPEGRTMSHWEKTSCPWYMEFPNWNHFINAQEQAAAEELQKGDGNVPEFWYPSSKLVHFNLEVEKAVARLEELLSTQDPSYDEKKVKAAPDKKKEPETSAKTDFADTSGKAKGPSAQVETPTSKKPEASNKPRDPNEQEARSEGTPTSKKQEPIRRKKQESDVTQLKKKKRAKKPKENTKEDPQDKTEEDTEEKTEEDGQENSEDARTEITDIVRPTNALTTLYHYQHEEFGLAELEEWYKGKHQRKLPRALRKFRDWCVNLVKNKARGNWTVDGKVQDAGANLMLVSVGTDTLPECGGKLPKWRRFSRLHLEAVLIGYSKWLLSNEGFICILHSGSLKQSAEIDDLLSTKECAWVPIESFFIWNDQGSYNRKNRKKVSLQISLSRRLWRDFKL